jgi:hypothetical protein
MRHVAALRSLRACDSAIAWASTQPNAATAWAACERGDWLLWLAARVHLDRKRLVQAACACARQALQYIPDGEDRPRLAIETAEAWARGEATIEELRKAADAASAAAAAAAYAYASAANASAAVAANASAADAAAAAANVAAWAAVAAVAYAAAWAAATHAADAATADAAAAANAPAATAARERALRRCAELVRESITWADIEAALEVR